MTPENLRRGLAKGEVEELRRVAWIGDAVLELYARSKTLEETHQRDLARKIRFVRNSFLNQLGQPTRVEAEIGRRFLESGLEAAFAWITENLGPLFVKQEAKLVKSNSGKARRSRQR